jgi:uncharacterized protein
MNTNSASSSASPSSSTSHRRLAGAAICLASISALGVVAFSRNAEAKPVGPLVVATQGDQLGPSVGRTIVVDGVGRVSQAPDRLIVNLGVETRAPRVADALKSNNTAAAAINKLIKERGVDAKDIQTSGLSIYPQFDNTGRKITEYQVNNTVTVLLRKLDSAGDLIDAVTVAGGDATRINGLNFSIGDSSKSEAEARKMAIADGRSQAEQLAANAGVKLGLLRTIRTSTAGNPGPQPAFAQDRAKEGTAAALESGSYEVSANVQLVFDIA